MDLTSDHGCLFVGSELALFLSWLCRRDPPLLVAQFFEGKMRSSQEEEEEETSTVLCSAREASGLAS